jgi:hypothetical protein
MPTITRPTILVRLSLILLAATAARADDPLTIRIYNDDADDVVVTVYDMNAQLPEPVLANQRINGFAWIPVSVAASVVGNGHVTWIARTAGVCVRFSKLQLQVEGAGKSGTSGFASGIVGSTAVFRKGVRDQAEVLPQALDSVC